MSHPVPPLPRMVLRVGFAGAQQIPDNHSDLERSLLRALEVIACRLAELAPYCPIKSDSIEPQRVTRFYDKAPPLLRLVTGLCEGGDSLAADLLEKQTAHPQLADHVKTELAAVIPFDFETYRSTRSKHYLPTFDVQAARCAYILEVDGIYEKPDPDTALARARRGKAYRAQGLVLLRHADILIAVADPEKAAGKPGGTLETVASALHFELPVVFINSATGTVTLVAPGGEPADLPDLLKTESAGWDVKLGDWVTEIMAIRDPEGGSEYDLAGETLLQEYFYDDETPELEPDGYGGGATVQSWGARFWDKFHDWFRPAASQVSPKIEGPKFNQKSGPYHIWRQRCTALSYHYSGRYRGGFFLNYVLAAAAVLLATFSLVLIAVVAPLPAEAVTGETGSGLAAAESAPQTAHPVMPGWFYPTLIVLGLTKLGMVWSIFRTTHAAVRGNWNDRAIDYRFLAERLRTMFYLPLVGSFQPPTASPPQYASRIVPRSAVDWLYDAIVRSISPAVFAGEPVSITLSQGTCQLRLLRLNLPEALRVIQSHWLLEQAVYHDRTARTMERMRIFTENWGKVLNYGVMAFVVADLGCLALSLIYPNWGHALHACAPWLVFFAAVLPAAVASMNGIRFQSECHRLAERSGFFRSMICGHSHAKDASPPPVSHNGNHQKGFFASLMPFWEASGGDSLVISSRGKLGLAAKLLDEIAAADAKCATELGSRTPQVLHYTEVMADIFVREITDWSVLYMKEFPDP